MAEAAHAHEHAHPNYVKVWGILVVLLVLSVLGPMLGIKIVTIIAAFGIAVVKAYLVVKNFMHINVEPKYIAYLVTTALAFMALLFFFVAPDVMRHEGQQWVNIAAKKASEDAAAGVDPDAPPFDAQQTFTTVCASCHGQTGGGDGPSAVSLNPKPAAFSSADFWTGKKSEDIHKVIKEGGAAVGKSPLMAPYGGVYNDDQIGELVKLIEGFKPEGAGTEAPVPAGEDTAAPPADTDAPGGDDADEAADTDAPPEEGAEEGAEPAEAGDAKVGEAKAG